MTPAIPSARQSNTVAAQVYGYCRAETAVVGSDDGLLGTRDEYEATPLVQPHAKAFVTTWPAVAGHDPFDTPSRSMRGSTFVEPDTAPARSDT